MSRSIVETASSNPKQNLPVLPLRNIVVFPHMIVPLFVGREKSVKALEEVMQASKQIVLVAQRDETQDDPNLDGLYRVGCLGNVLQMLKLPDGTVKVLVEGQTRVRITDLVDTGTMFTAKAVEFIEREGDENELEALQRTVVAEFEEYVKLNKKIPPEVLVSLSAIDEPARLADTIASHLNLKIDQKQELLEIDLVDDRLEKLYQLMENEIGLLQVERRIRNRVKKQMEKSQREYYLNEQMKAIQKELGEGEEGDFAEYEKKIKELKLSKEAKEKAEGEIKKLKMMSPMSAEATVVRNYLDVLLGLPWGKKSKLKKDLAFAEKVLNEDHFGLEKVKERIVEYLAVQSRVDQLKGPILCLVGPPGVGKTSLAESIAKATGREYVRMALGGVRDEAEIRGHRRTYIGALPGKIIQNVRKAGTMNPLFLLDEIDKLGMDFRGDPSSALLEVLDPAQNHTFNDHYLELDVDLSDVMFLCTSNTLNIPPALLDRMEVIRLAGYTEDEKLEIAKTHLVKRAMADSGIRPGEVKIDSDALQGIIRYYTREAGVRSLKRSIDALCRKAVKELVSGEATGGKTIKAQKARAAAAKGKEKTKVKEKIHITLDNLDKYLGVRQFTFGMKEQDAQVGLVTGLAWTEVGGDILPIEATVLPGKGKLITTGKLGEVMQESIHAASSYVRRKADDMGITGKFYEEKDVHVHVPDGATPKDGPSAGLAMVTALVSALTGIPVRHDIAMTGEVSLRGRAMQIGGLKEKLLAALRGGIKTVFLPRENVKDLADMPKNIKEGLEIIAVDSVDEVLAKALVRSPFKGGGASGKPGKKEKPAKGKVRSGLPTRGPAPMHAGK
ncbi:MAG TPA: endopeptidase La [Alphaproteobacteria bacterium]|nr:endopeptidase La [Alphaproteobacteria bacterium]